LEKFHFLRKFIFTEDDDKAFKSKHSFYALSDQDIADAEKRLGASFPSELRQFYQAIGYGFLWNESEDMMDRFMDPSSVVDFHLCEGMYEGQDAEEHYEENFLVFFEVSEVSYIAMDMSAKNQKGECPIYYLDAKIANSLEEFLVRLDANIDYYLAY
jgi:antitoxin YxxD